jgi:hypothetical protein
MKRSFRKLPKLKRRRQWVIPLYGPSDLHAMFKAWITTTCPYMCLEQIGRLKLWKVLFLGEILYSADTAAIVFHRGTSPDLQY